MQKFIKPEMNISVFERADIIVASGTVAEAKAWMQGETGAGAVSDGNVADFASIYD